MRTLSLAIRILLVPVNLLLVALGRARTWFERPRYIYRGRCQQDGACCQHLLFAEEPFLRWPVLQAATRFWLEKIYPFTIGDSAIMDPESGDYYRILGCRNLHDGRCAEYRLRPRICREWPLPVSHPPVLRAGCGYTVHDRLNSHAGDCSRRRIAMDPAAVPRLIRCFHERRACHRSQNDLRRQKAAISDRIV